MHRELKKIGELLLPAIAYGDAFGLNYEGKNLPYWERDVWKLTKITDNNWVGEWPTGTWSDDTHLSLAVADAIRKAGGKFNLEKMAKSHISAYQQTLATAGHRDWLAPAITTTDSHTGWGKGTTESVKRLIEGVGPTESGGVDGRGNGVLMKMAPLVFEQIAQETHDLVAFDEIEKLTRMTHGNDYSVEVAIDYANILKALYSMSSHMKRNFRSKNETNFSLISVLHQASPIDSEGVLIKATPKRGFLAGETLKVAVFYAKTAVQSGITQALHDAVRYGGDSDSICSIICVLALFAGRFDPPEDMDAVYDLRRLRIISERLVESIL